MSEMYTTIDLCAGIGGIRRGFEMTGRFSNVLSAEIDADARKTYELLYGEKPEKDLTTSDFKAKAVARKFDVLLAGFPCQTFSAVGLKKGFDDPNKGVIFNHIMDLLAKCQHKRCRPKAIFLENVEYLLSHDHENTINVIIDSIRRMHYRLVGNLQKERSLDGSERWGGMRNAFLRNSKDFGVPQNRPRVYLMAFDELYFGDAINAIAGWELPRSGEGPGWMDVDQILEQDMSKVEEKYYLSSGYWQTLINHRARHAGSKAKTHNGFGYVVVNDPRKDGGRKLSNTILATGGSGKECNLVRQAKPGLNTVSCVHGKKTPLNNDGVRMMMPKEWGRLQGFVGYAFMDKNGEDQFSFPSGLSDAQKYKQFGNSVTIPVIKSMAEFMLKCFEVMQPEIWDARVLGAVKKCQSITRNQLATFLGVDKDECTKIVRRLIEEGKLFQNGRRRGTFYTVRPGVYTIKVSNPD